MKKDIQCPHCGFLMRGAAKTERGPDGRRIEIYVCPACHTVLRIKED